MFWLKNKYDEEFKLSPAIAVGYIALEVIPRMACWERETAFQIFFAARKKEVKMTIVESCH